MNLLHVIPYYAPAWTYGGSVRAAADLARALVTAGHTVTVLTTDTLSATARITALNETIDGVEVVRVRNRSNALRGRLNLSTPVGIAAAAERLIDGARDRRGARPRAAHGGKLARGPGRQPVGRADGRLPTWHAAVCPDARRSSGCGIVCSVRACCRVWMG